MSGRNAEERVKKKNAGKKWDDNDIRHVSEMILEERPFAKSNLIVIT